jgi:hypothetical protein
MSVTRKHGAGRAAVLFAAALMLLPCGGGLAQEKFKRQTIQAVAMGQGTQLGRIFNVNVIIEDVSTPEDQKALIEAFASQGMEGLYNALTKMKSKGRLSMPGTLGYDIAYVRVFPTETGRRIRIVTDRPLTFGEARNSTRSSDYNLSALELDLDAKGRGEGTLLPACQFEIGKDNNLEIEALQNPWKLAEVRVH